MHKDDIFIEEILESDFESTCVKVTFQDNSKEILFYDSCDIEYNRFSFTTKTYKLMNERQFINYVKSLKAVKEIKFDSLDKLKEAI